MSEEEVTQADRDAVSSLIRNLPLGAQMMVGYHVQLIHTAFAAHRFAATAALERERDALRAALEGLEQANQLLCGMRSAATYESMVRDGATGMLLNLDRARAAARAALAQHGER